MELKDYIANNENKSGSENISRIKFDLHMHINTQN